MAFLWYNCTELDVLLQLDILQSAIEQKDSVADLCNRGFLTPDMARSFAAVCCKAIHEICQFKKIPWEVEVCSWADEKEMDRYTRLVVTHMQYCAGSTILMNIFLENSYKNCMRVNFFLKLKIIILWSQAAA